MYYNKRYYNYYNLIQYNVKNKSSREEDLGKISLESTNAGAGEHPTNSESAASEMRAIDKQIY